jgi:antitoxin MazE
MQTKIQKWGNSLAVRIPKAFAEEAQVAYGTSVNLSVDDGKIVIDPHTEPEYRLEELLKGVTKRNVHAEVDTGEAVGREIG